MKKANCLAGGMGNNQTGELGDRIDVMQLVKAVTVAYEMLIFSNLTKNEYEITTYDKFCTKSCADKGQFDDLIISGSETMHPDYQSKFLATFNREHLLERYASGEEEVYMEHLQMGDDGEYHWTFSHNVRLDNPFNDDVLQITLSRNIDKRKQEEERARKVLQNAYETAKQANLLKTNFLANVSHDIRTPMNAIIGLTMVSLSHLDDKDKVKDGLSKIYNSSQQLLKLINNVLDISKIESGKYEFSEHEFHIDQFYSKSMVVLKQNAKSKNQRLHFDASRIRHPMVIGDDIRISQIGSNIISNAIKYTGRGGNVWVSVREEPYGVEGYGKYIFTCCDDGIGMSEQFLQKIYNPFEREGRSDSKETGTGLGMSIVKNLVEKLNGSITVNSKVGKGTVVEVTIPLPYGTNQQGDVQDESVEDMEKDLERMRNTDFSSKRLLLVEDNEINMDIMKEILSTTGIVIECATNGAQAVEMVDQSQEGYFDGIIMDIQMPVMDGYEATRQIRKLDREDVVEIPIIAVTANTFTEDVRKAIRCGMNDYVTKPVKIGKMLDVLHKWFI